ncbi:hypothetical protein ACE1YR_22185 [Pseudomonas sp. K1(2024)]|uniref:Cthe-2314-like HEPN domain-containing protein n=1 Tax=Pseudomonas boreofloridensis TaxID=3064348 RepID=A0ABV4ZEP3_9PSED|nr:hypothetical protein [Pseudomonas sp. K13]MDO7904670.1 hypothetical protein [Pseudomonas sp. K13]
MREKYGLQFFNSDGSLLMEVGPHVVREMPQFSEKIGEIAACWAQAEVHLNCLFAVLLDVTPDDAACRLKRYKTAAQAAEGARAIAADYLAGEELKNVNDILDRLNSIRPRRNRIQHDVWARKGGVEDKLYAVHADQYLEFTTRMLELTESKFSEGEKVDQIIRLDEEFAGKVSASFTVEELEALEYELGEVSKDLMTAMFARLLARKEN